MSRLIRRSDVARLVVLALAALLTLAWVQITAPEHRSASSGGPRAVTRPAVADPPVGIELAGPDLAAVTTPLPVPATTPAPPPAPQKASPRHRRHAAGKHHRRGARRAHRHHRRAHHHRPNPWLHQGGRDIGWPQCPSDVGFRGHNGLGQPLPDAGVEFVVIGLTNGRAFTPNPCIDLHLSWVRSHHAQAAAYAFATYPTRAQLRRYRHHGPYDGRRHLGALANVGHATADFNVRLMRQHGFVTPHVWLDLEPSSSRPWSHRRSWNRAVVRGWVRGYRDAGYTVGFYSTTHLFDEIVGRLRLRLPEWRTAGPVSPRSALHMCRSSSFQGGPAVLAQWWTAHRDFDRMCPSSDPAATMARYFHQW
ncbi:hypothetical protein [Nocardioides pocheonensis]|uniref:hypothetical protein n=1 Tax=Nocardioides pocheonensis TaxID=661485 RepID=UPI0011CD737F|nr:hypothetical protein [Nocardioides pocheonensis]